MSTGFASMPQDTITVSGKVTDTDGEPIPQGQLLIFDDDYPQNEGYPR